jgi:hypothetical protein
MKKIKLIWNPHKDITAHELAQCLKYLLMDNITPADIDKADPIFRHFTIIDPE